MFSNLFFDNKKAVLLGVKKSITDETCAYYFAYSGPPFCSTNGASKAHVAFVALTGSVSNLRIYTLYGRVHNVSASYIIWDTIISFYLPR